MPNLKRATFERPDLLFNKHRAVRLTCSFLLSILLPLSTVGQAVRPGGDKDTDARTRELVIDEIVRQLRRRYVLPDSVGTVAEHLTKKLRTGGYDAASSAVRFAQALTEDLRVVADDLHFDVRFDPGRERALQAAGAGAKAKLPEIDPSPEELEELRKANFGFGEAKVMLGNVGYLEISSFVDLKYSKRTAVAAIDFVGNTDALIIDLRRNSGGSGSLVGFIIDHFFGPEPVALMSSYDRETDKTTHGKTSRSALVRRLPNLAVYVLTSRATGSAAEAFAFTLQQVGRAKTVGDRTAGAAHGGGWVPLGQGFIIFIPTFRGFNPRTGKSWNSVGVQPDIPTRSEESKEAAHFEAVKALLAKAKTESQKQHLSWILPLLELRAFGPKAVQQATLGEYAGAYDGIAIELADGQLTFLGASGIRRNLPALASDYFLIEDTTVPPENQARLRFVRNAEGKVVELQLLVSDGRVFRRPRK